FINMRGVGIAQSAPTSTPGVATYIDGVYIPHETFLSYAFYDMSSVEVLRGPQGTLTGQNSTGGAIYMRTTAPKLHEFSGIADVTVGNYSTYRTVGAVNVPMGDVFAARFAAVYDHKDSYTNNIGPSKSRPGNGSLVSARATLLFQPSDSLSFNLRYEHFDFGSDYNAIKNRNDAVTSDPYTIEEDARSFLNQDGYRASLEASWDINNALRLRAITSKQHSFNEDQADGDRTATALPVPANLPTSGANTTAFPGRVGFSNQTVDTKVTEINLLSSGTQRFNWVIGGFYMTEDIPVQVLRDNRNSTEFLQSNSSIIAKAKNNSKSGFADFNIKLVDKLELGVGARYSKDTQDYTRFALPGPPPPGCFPCTTKAESSQTTGRVGLKYFMADETMLYVTASRGYKAGGVNLDPRSANYGPETNTVGEFGVKSTVMDGHLRINGDVFYSDYKNIQVSALVAGLPSTINGAPARIYGAELETQGRFGGLHFNLGLGYLNTATRDAKVMTNGSVLPSVEQNVPAGTELPFSPTTTINGGVEYEFLLSGNQRLTPRLQMAYTGQQWATFFHNDKLTKVPSRTVIDARLTWEPIEKLQLEAYVTNLFDKTYIAVQVQEASSATGGYIYGPPRQFGGRFIYKF
ncbi:MAG TPA: TonB-dependent receptor, partial [Steroidobacteraceae bacterium]|nr:TonB-dependent receptor [Steroidobacteraceae bacterium]